MYNQKSMKVFQEENFVKNDLYISYHNISRFLLLKNAYTFC